MSLLITPEKVADHLERLVGDPTELRDQLEAHVRSKLSEAEFTARVGAVVLRRIRDKELYRPSGWPSWRAFCACFCPDEPERVDILIHALEVLESRGEKRDFGEDEARVLAGHGGDRRSEQARGNQDGNRHLDRKELNTVEHIKARLHRDDPELLARVERGELTANAAAVEMGWRKKRTPYDEVASAWKRCSPEERDRVEGLVAQRAVFAASDADELPATVPAGEIRPHPTVIVPLDVELAAARLRRHFAPEDRARLALLLVGEDDLP
jgi:hypothetical protein